MYEKIKHDIDDATWCAKYMGSPYVREGWLFPKNELLYFDGILPKEEPNRKIAVCDTAFGGGDSVSSPICYVYGEDLYIPGVVFNNGDKTITQPLVVSKYIEYQEQASRFESNNGGDSYCEQVDEQLRARGYRMNITSMRCSNQSSKMGKIIQYAPDIKRVHFLDDAKPNGKKERFFRDEDYKKFMAELTMTVMDQIGKRHDDAADSMQMLIEYITGGMYAKCEAIKRPF